MCCIHPSFKTVFGLHQKKKKLVLQQLNNPLCSPARSIWELITAINVATHGPDISLAKTTCIRLLNVHSFDSESANVSCARGSVGVRHPPTFFMHVSCMFKKKKKKNIERTWLRCQFKVTTGPVQEILAQEIGIVPPIFYQFGSGILSWMQHLSMCHI